ncbi:hypothetical protein B0F90DRAFT_1813084 [Multifurca ochricompacta]|uniref:Uncharacterized protein n=1 Tax=Multifurca ochricompacta TaxID=376703 RepID=A0AAD4MCK5_9AGAM|nr:hypothetical protein B0F90DRAFT_1813084 [Multifurca ochricompacta]
MPPKSEDSHKKQDILTADEDAEGEESDEYDDIEEEEDDAEDVEDDDGENDGEDSEPNGERSNLTALLLGESAENEGDDEDEEYDEDDGEKTGSISAKRSRDSREERIPVQRVLQQQILRYKYRREASLVAIVI